MKTWRIPLISWSCAVAGLLLMLLTNGALETLGLALLTTPLLLVARYTLTTSKS